jgi:2-polyprenyl-3-methyl-5-hydroxy-6-metoxy-1,4-benzoquinol methylase
MIVNIILEVEYLTRCIGCGSARLIVLAPQSNRRVFVTEGGEMTVRTGGSGCYDCGLVFLNPRMSSNSLLVYYRRQSRLPRLTLDPATPFSRLMDLQADFILKHHSLSKERSRILEVGSAEGLFLQRLNQRSGGKARLFGIEPSNKHYAYAKAVLPQATLYETMLEQAPLGNQEFSLIVLRHVLEHMPQPIACLKLLRTHLEQDGAMYIEVPDCQDVVPSISDFFIHEHLTYFTEETLTAVLARAGLRPAAIERFRGNPVGSGFSYPVLRTVAVLDNSVVPLPAPDQVHWIYQAYEKAREEFFFKRLDPVRTRLQELATRGARIALFGAGPHTMDLLECLRVGYVPWVLIFDNNPNKTGKTMCGIPIALPTAATFAELDCVLISSAEFEDEMVAQTRQLAGPQVEILTIYRDY